MGSDESLFYNFPISWSIVRIGDISKVKGGKRLPKGMSLIDEPTSHPYLRVVDFGDSRINEKNLKYVPDEVFPKIKRYTISSRDIYISIAGTIGVVGKVSERLSGANLTENAAKICEIDPLVNRDYLLSFLRSRWGKHQINAQTVGSTQPKLALFRISDIKFPLPPLPEQRAIAHILGTLDDKIELNRQMNETLEGIARAMFKSWFVDFDPVRAKAEGCDTGLPPDIANLFPDSFVDSESGPIPKGWEVTILSKVAEVVDCLHSKKPDIYPDGNYLLLQVYNVGQCGRLDLTNPYLIRKEDYVKWTSRIEITAGDLIITKTGRVGAVAQIPHGVKAALGRNMVAIKAKAKISTPQFLKDNMLSEVMRREINSRTNDGTILRSLHVKNINKLKLILPPISLLNNYTQLINPFHSQMEINNQESANIAVIRNSLLPKLLSGELRVPEAEKIREEKLK
ncbi:MAG: restriction endonuclease subunit S [bacterium]|nr:restriction endonuclease subunit S [bacterium]